jgi:molybdopterin converting factor small subunit
VKVRVLFFSHLKDAVGSPAVDVEVAESSTVAGLLDHLYVGHPKLRAWDSSILVGAGVEFVERNYVIQPNDEIAIMPPVQGG